MAEKKKKPVKSNEPNKERKNYRFDPVLIAQMKFLIHKSLFETETGVIKFAVSKLAQEHGWKGEEE